MRYLPLAAVALAALALDTTLAATPQVQEPGRGDEARKDKQKDGPKPYDDVIPESAVTDIGLFSTHRPGKCFSGCRPFCAAFFARKTPLRRCTRKWPSLTTT